VAVMLTIAQIAMLSADMATEQAGCMPIEFARASP
jgi:hypothetical protein